MNCDDRITSYIGILGDLGAILNELRTVHEGEFAYTESNIRSCIEDVSLALTGVNEAEEEE